jgi:hypothetical protein
MPTPQGDPLMGFGKVHCHKKKEQTKVAGELLRDVLYASWLKCYPIVKHNVFSVKHLDIEI